MTVAPDWVGVGHAHLQRDPRVSITGRVLPFGDAARVPSTNVGTRPRRYGRGAHPGVLYAGNMGIVRREAVALGLFDERVVPAAEDCDFSYRWLRSGRYIDFCPSFTVWHHDWRDEAQLRALYAAYAEGQGVFYAKHLRRADPAILRLVLIDLFWALRSWQRGLRNDCRPEPIEETVRQLPMAIVRGWRRLRTSR
jgi:GT2 family glycosyltransferase